MFTQTLKINTNKCNGCAKHCLLDAAPSTKKKGAYIPTIDGKAYVYFYDQNRIKRAARKHFNKYSTIDQARTIARYCKDYKPKFLTEITQSTNNTNICTGCSLRCTLNTIQTNQGFMPTINNQIIYEHTNAYGDHETTSPRETQEYGLSLAKQIARRCDFYKKQLIKEHSNQTK